MSPTSNADLLNAYVDQLKHITNQKEAETKTMGRKAYLDVDDGAKPHGGPQCHQSKAPKHTNEMKKKTTMQEEAERPRRAVT